MGRHLDHFLEIKLGHWHKADIPHRVRDVTAVQIDR
jgi:hypothetical protein